MNSLQFSVLVTVPTTLNTDDAAAAALAQAQQLGIVEALQAQHPGARIELEPPEVIEAAEQPVGAGQGLSPGYQS